MGDTPSKAIESQADPRAFGLVGAAHRGMDTARFAPRFLTPTEVAAFLGVSLSWLAKRRMTGDGPPFVKVGRSVRYSEAALLQWIKSRQRLSTSEQ